MGRKLSTTVLIGGVVYEPGTDEADIVGADTIRADVWGGEPDAAASGEAEQGDAIPAADVAALRGQYDAQIAERDEQLAGRDARIADLEEQIEGLTAEIEQLKETSPTPDPKAPADYSSLDLDALKAEIDRRNEGRDDAARIGKRGSQETLAAALTADDAAKG